MDIELEKNDFEEVFEKNCGASSSQFERDELGFYEWRETQVAWMMWQAAKAQAVPEGYILIPKKMPDEVNDHLWDFMTDNFVCTNDYGDSFMACDDFNLDKFYAELIEATVSSCEP